MKKIILTSPNFTGNVVFAYNEQGILVIYHNESDMDEKALRWLLKYLPNDVEGLKALSSKITGRLEEVPADVSFDAFWNLYDKKVNRKRSEPMFKKLTDEEKLQCVVAVKPYKRYCSNNGRGIADPEKYINQRYFETDWRNLK